MRVPMFPLQNVVLPGELLPLNMFEPRYRKLLLDCLAADGFPDFGVVLIERGNEVGGGEERTSIGTVTRVVRVFPMGNRRFNVVTSGIRRVNVLEWLPDDPYPIGDVEDWPDPEPADPQSCRSRIEELAERARAVRKLARDVAKATKQRLVLSGQLGRKVSDEPVRASYQLAAWAPLGPADRYRMLVAPSVDARLDTLARALDDVEAMLRFRLS